MSEPTLLPIEEIVRDKPVEPLNAWIVAAYWRAGWWTVFPDLFSSHESARIRAGELPIGWTHRTILRVEVPGS